MPIVFEQPDPIGTSQGLAAAQGGGAVQQYNQDRQAQLQLLAMSQRAQEASQANYARGNAANSEAATQAGIAGQQQNRLADQFAQQQIDQADQRAQAMQAAAQMQQNQFSYQDGLRLQRTQAGMTQLSQMHSDGQLSDDEYQEGLANLQGVAGPLLLRQQTAKAQASKMQLDQIVEQGKHVAAMNSADLATRSAEFNRRIVDVPDGQGGSVKAWIDSKGDAKPVSDLAGKITQQTAKGAAGSPIPQFDLKEAAKEASKSAMAKDPETGATKFDAGAYTDHLNASLEAHQRISADLGIEHYTSELNQLRANAPNNDLNQLKGADFMKAQKYAAELTRFKGIKAGFAKKDQDAADEAYMKAPANDDIGELTKKATMFANKNVQRGSLFNFQGWQFYVDHQGNLLLNQNKKKPVSQDYMMPPTPTKQSGPSPQQPSAQTSNLPPSVQKDVQDLGLQGFAGTQ